jgi:hypothetical protein
VYCVATTCGTADDGKPCIDQSGLFDTCCGGACNALNDPANCGQCGIACLDGGICLAGQCLSPGSCSFNGGLCAYDGGQGVCCAGQCVAESDPLNCGGICGQACPIGTTCDPAANYYSLCVDDAGSTTACSQDSNCPQGYLCPYNRCISTSCADGGGFYCALGEDAGIGYCCQGQCIDLSQDNALGVCGECSWVCPQGATCSYGACTTPDGGMADCSDGGCIAGLGCLALGYTDVCVPFACGPQSEGQSCLFGLSHVGTCCGGSCVDLYGDPDNCGNCGQACTSGACLNGCTAPIPQLCVQTCGPGTLCAVTDCVDSICQQYGQACVAQDGQMGFCCDLSCVDLQSDPLNCGSCGLTCVNGTACVNGLCNGDTVCGPGHADSYCNLDAGISYLCCPGAGCIDTSGDSQNCGACGNVCAQPTACDAGACVISGPG